MKSITGISLADVQNAYSGPEGRLWELIMGELWHCISARTMPRPSRCSRICATKCAKPKWERAYTFAAAARR